MRGVIRRIGALAVIALAVSSCSNASPDTPTLQVSEVADGFDHPWDVGFLPGGAKLLTQRPGKLTLVDADGEARQLAADTADVYAHSEGGLLGIAVRPDSADEFITCQTHAENGKPVDIRLVNWKLSADRRSAARLGSLLTGIPLNPSGRHSGCRPTFGSDGMALVGTGDTATAAVAQDRHSLGGKVLRIDPRTGQPPEDNPFAGSTDQHERYLLSYGHRNVQGVAVRPGSGDVFTAEHGPNFDDEVNLNLPGRNYGWDPSKGGTEGGYDENVPMTDTARFPEAVRPLWTSGKVTQAISGADFLRGKQWGALDGALAVVALKGQKLLLYKISADDKITQTLLPKELNDSYGRLRTARTGPDGALYITTDNGGDDKLLRVAPA